MVVALLAPVLAGDRPVVLGAATTIVIEPLIPFRAGTTALSGRRYAPPLTRSADGQRHWLGTDRLGRDVAAGLIAGARVAVVVGLGSVGLALLIGMPLGAVAGFFGDRGWRAPRLVPWSVGIGLLLGSGYTYASLRWVLGGQLLILGWIFAVGIGTSATWLVLRLASRWISGLRRPVPVPLDRCVVFLIEAWSSVPGLIVLIALVTLVPRPTLGLIVLIIGLLGWPSIARFLRAELLRIRELTYISAARITGVGEWGLLWRHALPNAIAPLVVVAAFLLGSSILAEASLSFLGLGLPADQVTWGSLLQQSRARPEAWWLAVFPGLLLTVTVLACNRLRR